MKKTVNIADARFYNWSIIFNDIEQPGESLAVFIMREMLDVIDKQFFSINEKSKEFIHLVPQEILYRSPREMPRTFTIFSCGEYILRSAAAVEQCFGGISTRLWDDPFEWTLTESLMNTELISNYLDEVESTRTKTMTFFNSDAELLKKLPAPEKVITIFELLIRTIRRAEQYQGRAFAVFQYFSDEKLPKP